MSANAAAAARARRPALPISRLPGICTLALGSAEPFRRFPPGSSTYGDIGLDL
jgi:hypothetical protein